MMATEIIRELNRCLIRYRLALVIALTGNVIQAVVWFIR